MIALASDHGGFELKHIIMSYFDEKGIAYKDFGTVNAEASSYAEYGLLAAKAVASGECEKGIVFCGTGVGISITANKVRGIRCVVCTEPYSALLSRRHNDTNMLALGGRIIGAGLAVMIVESWLEGVFEGGRHAVRVGQITKVEENEPLS